MPPDFDVEKAKEAMQNQEGLTEDHLKDATLEELNTLAKSVHEVNEDEDTTNDIAIEQTERDTVETKVNQLAKNDLETLKSQIELQQFLGESTSETGSKEEQHFEKAAGTVRGFFKQYETVAWVGPVIKWFSSFSFSAIKRSVWNMAGDWSGIDFIKNMAEQQLATMDIRDAIGSDSGKGKKITFEGITSNEWTPLKPKVNGLASNGTSLYLLTQDYIAYAFGKNLESTKSDGEVDASEALKKEIVIKLPDLLKFHDEKPKLAAPAPAPATAPAATPNPNPPAVNSAPQPTQPTTTPPATTTTPNTTSPANDAGQNT
ncbi:MAG: hypothetical protein ABL890_01770 [Candidatus Peribacteraceae bacterium]